MAQNKGTSLLRFTIISDLSNFEECFYNFRLITNGIK